MAEIYVNSNFPVRTTIFYAGEPYVADGPVSVNVYDITEDPAITPPINPGTLIIQLSATELETDPGTYQVVLPMSLTNRAREFKLEWIYTVNYQPITHTSHLDIVVPYCDIAEVMQDSNFGLDPSDPNYKTYHELIMAEKYARKVIDSVCGQSFYLYDDIQISYGAGTNILALPFKLAALHELYADDYLLVDTINNVNNWGYTPVISETGFGLRVDMQSFTDNTVYTANGLIPPTINDLGSHGAFRSGVRYRIQGRFGWDEVPENIEEAAVYLIKDYFTKDATWRNKYLKSVQTFDWQFEFASGAYTGTGNAYVDALIAPYILTNMMVI